MYNFRFFVVQRYVSFFILQNNVVFLCCNMPFFYPRMGLCRNFSGFAAGDKGWSIEFHKKNVFLLSGCADRCVGYVKF